jgi:hypothetical protein
MRKVRLLLTLSRTCAHAEVIGVACNQPDRYEPSLRPANGAYLYTISMGTHLYRMSGFA